MPTQASQYPKEFDTGRILVPFASMTDIATVDCEVLGIEVQNSTAATITLTVQDKQGTPRKLLDAINIDPGYPYVFEFNGREARCSSGVSWQASATGLYGRLVGNQLASVTGITTDAPL